MKRLTCLIIVFIMCFSVFSVNGSTSYADSTSRKVVTLSEEDIFIEESDAIQIATMFINDIIDAGFSEWTSDPNVIRVVKLFDQTGNYITAYSVELSKGYIIVSAYLGLDNIILEWSDVADPVYSIFDVNATDRIVYTGSLDYFKDSGRSALETTDGILIQRNQIHNQLESARNVENVPSYVREAISNNPTRGYITDPYTHANTYYTGPFVYSEHINQWDSSTNPINNLLKTSDYFGYVNHCGPVAVANTIRIISNVSSFSNLSSYTNQSLFDTAINVGLNRYYFNPFPFTFLPIGTTNDDAGQFALENLNEYGLTATVTKNDILNPTNTSNSYLNIKNSLAKNNTLLYLVLTNNTTYNKHHLICYAYTRLVSQTTGAYKTYLKVADGRFSSPRYLDLSDVLNDFYFEISNIRWVN